MTVREFIRWLESQDQEATVRVVQHTSGKGYYDQGGNASEVDFTPELSEYTDLRGNPHITPNKSYYNQRTLLLGEING